MRQGRTILAFSLACLAFAGTFTVFGAGAVAADDKDKPIIILDTTEGPITIQLDRAKAPISVENFLKYVDAGHFEGTIFHRVIPGFMIQGGGMTKDQREKRTRAPIKNEAGNGLKNLRGTIAMARTGEPDSATSQFFINLKDNGFLDRDQAQDGVGYTVFGKVIEGMDVVDKIAAGKTRRGVTGENSEPVNPVSVKSAKKKG
jgi:peptidyl-prolyl cis-trans isomerase A (cyclophilin A)